MARIVQIALTPLEESTTGYSLTLPATTWDDFLATMVRMNTTQGESLDEALRLWTHWRQGQIKVKESTYQ